MLFLIIYLLCGPVIRRGELIQTIHRGYGRSSHRIMEVLNNE